MARLRLAGGVRPHSAALPFLLGPTLAALSAAASAQQFQAQAGVLPAGSQYTEGVECADVDLDGDLDVFFAHGPGFASASAPVQNTLLINKLVENGSLSLADESVARLGVSLSNAKMVFTGDVDDDGWVDAMFANAFNVQPPFLYMNRGVASPGSFLLESSTRGFTENLNSASGEFGDVDDDGDLDVILCDSGVSYFGGSGGTPRLYLNDGTGVFTEATGPGWAPPTKTTHMDVRLVDIDDDLDLDFFGVCRAGNAGGNHYLMLNDGSGAFTDVSSSLPGTSTSVYEAEVGDLDGDNDLDFFFTSLSGFSEGAVRNDLFPSGTLSFATVGTLSGSFDDNEVVLIDYDDDGDLDPLVGSLDSTEALWRNNGGMSFTAMSGLIQSIADSTLDCTVADMDGDGDYDLITAQGESGSFTNRYYSNNGPADTRGPRVLRHGPPAELTPAGPWVAKARVQDAVVDDGVTYITGKADYVVLPAPAVASVSIDASAFSPASLTIPAGTCVEWTNTLAVAACVFSTTAPYVYESPFLGTGQTYEVCFVTPGVYQYTNLLGTQTGTITVTGSPNSVAGKQVGSGLFRFEFAGSAPAGSRLVYQLEFTDGVGNARTEVFQRVDAVVEPGSAYCFGDGGDQLGCTACACANEAPIGTPGGCLNSAGRSGRLLGSGTASVANDTLRFELEDASSGVLSILFSGNAQLPTNAANPCFGMASGVGSVDLDGLRCAGQAVLRHGGRTTDVNGDAGVTNNGWGPPSGPPAGLIGQGGFAAGATRHFQVFYRDLSTAVCGTGLNSTNGYSVTMQP